MIAGVDLDAVDRAAVDARPRLLAIAYRMLGSMSDAEDVVSDALEKARRSMPAEVSSVVAYLTTVTTRTAIDHLRSARVRRERYVGPWLPEPVLRDPAPDAADAAVLAESLSMAFLVVLEALSPEERAALLLHDAFDYSHAEVAAILGRSEGASRQLLRRARQRIKAERPRFDVDRRRHEAVVRGFLAACEGGGVDDFLALLTDGAVLVSDGGAAVRAARRPVHGAERVARFLANIIGRSRGDVTFRAAPINGQPGVVLLVGRGVASAVLLDVGPDGRIATVRIVVSPEKLGALQRGLAATTDDRRPGEPANQQRPPGQQQ
ncbi:MAG: RNA polymerase sigma factor SigJ [Acidimicrobiales bacterium]